MGCESESCVFCKRSKVSRLRSLIKTSATYSVRRDSSRLHHVIVWVLEAAVFCFANEKRDCIETVTSDMERIFCGIVHLERLF